MSDQQTDRSFDLSELHGITADQQTVKESNAFRTLRAGNYRLTAEKAEGRASGEQFKFGAGIKMVHLQLDAKSLDGGRGGKLFQDITPTTLRDDAGKLARQTKLWGNYEKALSVEAGTDAADVAAKILMYPVDGYVNEMFVAPDNSLHFYKTEEERAVLVAAGMEPKNFIASVRAAK